MADWTFVLTTLSGTEPTQGYGELLQAKERSLVLPLNRVPTATFKVRHDHPFVDTLLSGDCLLRAYRGTDPTPEFHGQLVSAEEVANANEQSVQANFAGPFWRLTKRLIGTSKAGIAWGTVGAELDRVVLAQNILDLVNSNAYTGITPGTFTPCGSTGRFLKVHYHPAAEAISQLAATYAGFDFEVVPTDPVTNPVPYTGTQLGVMNAQAVIGTSKPNVVFQFGGGEANVSEYKRNVSNEGLMTKGHILYPNFPDLGDNGDTPREPLTNPAGYASSAITARGVYEDVVQSELADDTARADLLNSHVAVRQQARQIVTFTPFRDAYPAPFTDYVVGDQVRCVAEVEGVQRLDAMLRIYGIAINLDEFGTERIDLELVTPEL